ncbi:uroporphyrinogen-III synthase [Thalassobacillus pellis]|uniref:uroporphyrinogen-III synthase n=1 Tax=Thalassobacillus pellis TaxID=748008 RepID=UPI00195F6797|nr:uroporphyrinogen-III synthase [Thalassobacillus pellis]MBM7554604.1 uroporphyrinogen-III synthase [Thalassobacillus pellis]
MENLQGRTILVTRSKKSKGAFSEQIRKAGGNPVEVPLLQFAIRDTMENNQMINGLHDYNWVFFTSINGVEFFFELWNKHKKSWPANVKLAAVGEKTGNALLGQGINVDFVPDTFSASNMADQFLKRYPEPGRILLVRGNLSRPTLPEVFRQQRVFFQTMTVYDTLPVEDQQASLIPFLERGLLDAYTFTSPSTISAFHNICCSHKDYHRFLLKPCVCIGPTTASEAEKTGFSNVLTPPSNYTIEGMIEVMERYFKQKGQDING